MFSYGCLYFMVSFIYNDSPCISQYASRACDLSVSIPFSYVLSLTIHIKSHEFVTSAFFNMLSSSLLHHHHSENGAS